MNELEQLSRKNRKNYLQYLKRMTTSIKTSTKGLIPSMCGNSKNILDVGCGSGVILEAISEINNNSHLTGLDLNNESISRLRQLGKNWKLYHMNIMDMKNMKFDTVIFSSVLHEISSYNIDTRYRFTSKPINDTMRKTNELLEMHGSIILRDGLLVDVNECNKKVLITFINPCDSVWLYRFRNDFRGFDKLPYIDRSIEKISDNTFMVQLAFLKEFLYTFTWGSDSYEREVKERFGILRKNEWISLLEETGFSVQTIVESKEEYEKYLSPKVIIHNDNGSEFTYPMMTILIKANKHRELVKSR